MSNKKLYKWGILIAGLMVLCLVVSIISLCVGSVNISLTDIVDVILNGQGTSEYSILIHIRLPRILLGLAVGGSLSLAGAILQGIFRNPLVEPFTLGISGGASLGVCLTIVFKLHILFGIVAFPLAGFAGAVVTMVFVYILSSKKGIMRIQGILLTGVMISYISTSMVMLIMSVSKSEDVHGIIFWIMGSLDEPNSSLIAIAIIFSLIGLACSYLFCMDLNAFALGEEEAIHLGVNVERTKRILFLIASILTGISVSVVGIIGFVGLIIPHLIRLFTGPDHRILFLASFLAGGAFLVVCDTIARTVISPLELPVGVITGIIGGMVFIYALNKKKMRL
jgi:iron complex transport system permease protein